MKREVFWALPITVLVLTLILLFSQSMVLPSDSYARDADTASADTIPITPEPWEWLGGSVGDIVFVDEAYGWAISGGLLVKTVDGGETWFAQHLPAPGENRTYYGVHFIDRNNGWVVGEKDNADLLIDGAMILHTTDGGGHWEMQYASDEWHTPMKWVQFADGLNGWAGCRDFMITTADGGQTWQRHAAGVFHLLSPEEGWVARFDCGDGGELCLAHWLNGGWYESETVDPNPSGLFTLVMPKAVTFVDSQHGWIVGTEQVVEARFDRWLGFIVSTDDGGQTWTWRKYDSPSSFSDVFFIDDQHGWVVAGGALWKTDDGGQTWAPQESPLSGGLKRIQLLNAHRGWAAGSWGIQHTVNGGTTWRVQKRPTTGNAIHFPDKNHGWVVGASGLIRHTNDGGDTWQTQSSGVDQTLNAVYFVNATTGWAVGDEGTILFTNDGGVTWTGQTSTIPENLTGVYFISPNQGWIISDAGAVLLTTDGGATWTSQDSGIDGTLMAIQFVNSEKGWILGRTLDERYCPVSTGVRTTDGGLTWTKENAPAGRDLDFTDEQHGWIVTSWGPCYSDGSTWAWVKRTEDGGDSWETYELPWIGFFEDMEKIDFADLNNGWIGETQAILRSQDGGLNWYYVLAHSGNVNDLSFVDKNHGWVLTSAGTLRRSPVIVASQINQSANDTAVRVGTGENLVNARTVRLGQSNVAVDGYVYASGFRFDHLNIPQNAHIVSARLQLHYASWSRGLPAPLTVYAEASDNAPDFSNGHPLASERLLTSASIPWMVTEEPEGWFESPELAALIQEIVDRPGWQPGNALAILIHSAAEDDLRHYLDVHAYDMSPHLGAKLIVSYYSLEPAPMATPTPTATPRSTSTPTSTPTATPRPTFTPTPTPRLKTIYLPMMELKNLP